MALNDDVTKLWMSETEILLSEVSEANRSICVKKAVANVINHIKTRFPEAQGYRYKIGKEIRVSRGLNWGLSICIGYADQQISRVKITIQKASLLEDTLGCILFPVAWVGLILFLSGPTPTPVKIISTTWFALFLAAIFTGFAFITTRTILAPLRRPKMQTVDELMKALRECVLTVISNELKENPPEKPVFRWSAKDDEESKTSNRKSIDRF